MKRRTADDFAQKHDPKTIIPKLEKQLAAAHDEIGMQAFVKGVLGTLELDEKRPSWLAQPLKNSGSPGVPTLFLSDFHWGERVFRDQLGGVNEYDLKIAHARLEHTVNTAIHLLGILDKDFDYPGIVLPLGGDMISGDIHDELSTTNELPSIPTVLNLYDALVPIIDYLVERFGNVFIPCVSGNHGRNTKKIQAKNRNRTSFDWMLYQFLARRYAGNEHVTLYIPEGPDALYRVMNTTFNLTHGDQFKAGDSIIGAIGPLMRGNQKKTAKHASINRPYDVMMCGHWHQYIHLSRLIVNGALKGYDEYADSNNYIVEPPQQALFVTHPKYGINWRMPVLCEAPKAGSKSDWVSVPRQ